MGEVAKDLGAGTVGGIAQLVVGHPFDTIKVKLQSQPTPLPGQLPKYSGAIDAVKQTLGAEGARGLYKGMGAPLATVAAFNALLFSVRGQMETILRSEPGAPLTVQQQVIAGAGAGCAVSILATPTELIKCRLQAQGGSAGSSVVAEAGAAVTAAVKYGGPMDVAKQVLRTEGGVRGLFKGLFPTLAREVPGNATMFGVYEAIKQYMAGGTDTSGLGRGSLMMAGGLAGGAFWISVYPTDVIKSVIQIDDYKNPKYSGSIDACKKILKSEGIGGLYKGFGPAMGRSIPANAACFLAYEVTRKMVKMEDPLQSHSSLPLLSKPNNMESFMKQITRNPNVSRWRYIFSFGKKNNECVPMKATVVEANNKTYLIDRIETLEDRLIQ
nr:mitochondrial carnitine/acylcarnitine carrier-like protein [Tanacetum cinerariifolium]